MCTSIDESHAARVGPSRRSPSTTDGRVEKLLEAERCPDVVALGKVDTELDKAANVVHGRLKLASLHTPLLSIVPPALDALRRQHPELRVELFGMEPERSLPAVVLGEYDVATKATCRDPSAHRQPTDAIR